MASWHKDTCTLPIKQYSLQRHILHKLLAAPVPRLQIQAKGIWIEDSAAIRWGPCTSHLAKAMITTLKLQLQPTGSQLGQFATSNIIAATNIYTAETCPYDSQYLDNHALPI